MKKLTILSTLALSGIFLAGTLHAGNTRTLTTGIGTGTVPSGIPTSHPYTSKRKSTNTRNAHAEISLDNFRTGGYSSRPDSTFSAGSAPTSFPGQGASHMNPTAATNAGSHLPTFSSFPPNRTSNPGSGMPSSLGTIAPPLGNIPVGGSVASVTPSGIGSSNVGFAIPPTTIPGISNISNSTALNAIPSTIGGGGIPSTVTAPPATIPPPIPALPDAAGAGMTAAQAGLERRGGGRP